MQTRRGRWNVEPEECERSSDTLAIPPELRGDRVMTRLSVMAGELRALGQEPTAVHLSAKDEFLVFSSAEHTFGAAGAHARVSRDTWRAFLHQWFRSTMALDLVLDAPETRVT